MNSLSRLPALRTFIRRGLALRLLIAIVLFSSLITLIITATQLFFDYRHDVSLINTRMQQIENVHLEVIESSLWDLDKEYASVLIDGLLELPDMIYLEIRNGEDIWVSAGSLQQGQLIDRQFQLFQPQSGQSSPPTGSFRAVASLEQVYRRIFDRAVTLVASNALKTFLVAGFILLLVHLLVTRHLRHVSEWALQREIDDPTPLKLDREQKAGAQTDELDQLVDGLNTMRENLRTSFSELRQAEQERELLVEELEAKNKRLERFAYTVSHELKTPLVTISGFTGMLRRDLEQGRNDRFESNMSQIESAAKTMSSLLEDLLHVSRIGYIDGAREAIPLDELARNASQHIQFQENGQKIKVDIEPDLPVVMANRTQMLEVMQNLIENAAKFSSHQDRLQITIGASDDKDRTICFVRDNGDGIDPEYQQRIFNLFERLDQNIEGTGVGLALVSSIIEVHGGNVWVESEGLGKGSTFYFSLPRD